MSETITRKFMFFFPKCECEKPIIYHLVKDYNLVVNVYRARVTPEEEGYLVLDLTGIDADIDKALTFLKSFNVVVNSTGKGVTWSDSLCTHCGHCVTHCRSRALHFKDPGTREMAFDDAKCIECLACIRVCPFGACASAF